MKCPNCNETLLMSERHGIEIDYCPSCRGVWLDKGELDKMLEFAAGQTGAAPQAPGNTNQYSQPNQVNQPGQQNQYNQSGQPGYDPYPPQDKNYGKYYDHDKDHHYKHGHGRPHKKKGFLDNLFDFD